MKTLSFEDKEAWAEFRKGRISGSIADDVFAVKEVTTDTIKSILDKAGVEYKKSAKKDELLALVPSDYADDIKAKLTKKLAFYELLAQRVAVSPDEEDPMDRGNRLESEALELFAEKIGKEISNDLVVWQSDTNESIIYSPDGCISDEEVAEVKCLSSAMHLYIYYEKDIPAGYRKQNLQAFIVNDKLQKLHFVCYDPRIPSLPIHSITITREQIADDIALYKQYEIQLMEELNELVAQLTF